VNKQVLDRKTVKELRTLARRYGITGLSKLRKTDLIRAISKAEADIPRRGTEPKTPIRSGRTKPDPKLARFVTTVLDGKPEKPEKPQTECTAEQTEPRPEWQEPTASEAPGPQADLSPRPEPLQHSRVVLMIQDPHWLHAYWEIAPASLEEARRALGQEWESSRRVLRIRDLGLVSGNGNPHHHDRDLDGSCQNLYFESEPDHAYQVIVGYASPSGRFYAIAKSNQVRTPRAGMSDVIDPEWRTLRSQSEYEQLYALSGGFRVGAGSLELREQLERFLEEAVSSGSGGISSFGSPFAREQFRQRGFWFNLDCELIVYGATDPDATVTVQGQPVQLRPDGTFTLRLAFPDGEQVIDATARSADGVEERTIIPTVTRTTEVREPVLEEQGAGRGEG